MHLVDVVLWTFVAFILFVVVSCLLYCLYKWYADRHGLVRRGRPSNSLQLQGFPYDSMRPGREPDLEAGMAPRRAENQSSHPPPYCASGFETQSLRPRQFTEVPSLPVSRQPTANRASTATEWQSARSRRSSASSNSSVRGPRSNSPDKVHPGTKHVVKEAGASLVDTPQSLATPRIGFGPGGKPIVPVSSPPRIPTLIHELQETQYRQEPDIERSGGAQSDKINLDKPLPPLPHENYNNHMLLEEKAQQELMTGRDGLEQPKEIKERLAGWRLANMYTPEACGPEAAG